MYYRSDRLLTAGDLPSLPFLMHLQYQFRQHSSWFPLQQNTMYPASLLRHSKTSALLFSSRIRRKSCSHWKQLRFPSPSSQRCLQTNTPRISLYSLRLRRIFRYSRRYPPSWPYSTRLPDRCQGYSQHWWDCPIWLSSAPRLSHWQQTARYCRNGDSR